MTNSLHTLTSGVKTAIQDLWSNGRGWILLAVSAGWALSIGVRFVYPALIPFLQTEFQISLTTTGLLLTMLWGSYAIGHIPGGILGDRIGEGNILVYSTLISAGTVLVLTISVNVLMLFTGTVAFGLATALYGPTRFTVFTNIYSERAGSAIGLTMAAGSLSNTVLPVLATFVATSLTWRYGFGMFFPPFIAVIVVLWIVLPGRTSGQTSEVNELSKQTVRRIVTGIRQSSITGIVSVQICLSFVIQGFASFYPKYLISVKGISPAFAATLFGLFFAIGAVIQPVAGGVMDRFGAKRTLIGFLSGCILALWMLPFFQGVVPLVIITVFFSCWNGCGVITQTHIADSLPQEMRGTGLGILKAGWMLLGATSPLLIGILADHGYFNEGFLLLAVIGSLGLVLSITRL